MLTKLSTILLQAGLLDLHQEESLIEQVNASGISMPEALVSAGIFNSSELTAHLSSIFGIPCEPLSNYDYTALCQKLRLRELITSHHTLPLERTPSTLTLPLPTQRTNKLKMIFALLPDYKST